MMFSKPTVSIAVTTLIAISLQPAHASVCGVSCSSLQEAHDAIKDLITEDDKGCTYDQPSTDEVNAMEGVVMNMMYASPGDCESITLPIILTAAGYELEEITDVGNQYCIFATVTAGNGIGNRALFPWGSVIVNLEPTAQPLSIDIPHPRNDYKTSNQGIVVFRDTNAKVYVVSGSERDTDVNAPACGGVQDQDDYYAADAAHNDQHGFHAAVLAVADYYTLNGLDHTAIQFHGIGTSSCPGVDAYLTHGRSSSCPATGTDKINYLRNEFLQAASAAGEGSLVATVPGDSPSCDKSGTKNTQGRYLNGIAREDVCDTALQGCGYTQKVCHV